MLSGYRSGVKTLAFFQEKSGGGGKELPVLNLPSILEVEAKLYILNYF